MRKLWALAVCGIIVAVVPSAPAEAGNPDRGQPIYEANCASCHGSDGMALVPGTPHFRKSERLNKPDGALLSTIRTGKNLMPAWQGTLRETEMVDVVAYVRTLAR